MLSKAKKNLKLPVLLLIVALIFPALSFAQDIWLVPKGGPQGAPDYFALFDHDAPWARAAVSVRVFEVSTAVLSTASDADLKKMFANLRERHIALAIDMLPLTGGADKCGFHVEGYSAPGQSLTLARKIKSLGGEPEYYDMDEPLFFGHFYDKENACRSSIQDIASDVAEKIKQVRSIFPSVKIGESEPILDVARNGTADLAAWLDAFQRATGTPLSFMRFDMNWNADWRQKVAVTSQLLRRKRTAVQAIFNGSGRDRSDEEWISEGLANGRAFVSVVRPDAIAIQTWNAFPTRVLPETDPRTLTGMIDRLVSSGGVR